MSMYIMNLFGPSDRVTGASKRQINPLILQHNNDYMQFFLVIVFPHSYLYELGYIYIRIYIYFLIFHPLSQCLVWRYGSKLGLYITYFWIDCGGMYNTVLKFLVYYACELSFRLFLKPNFVHCLALGLKSPASS